MIGSGFASVVWLAQDNQVNEEVALKFFAGAISSDPAALRELLREAQRSRRLSHPNIARLLDIYHTPGEATFLALEYVHGESLEELRTQQMDQVFRWEDLKEMVEQVCAGLEYGHGEGLAHGNIKPSNLLLEKRGRMKLADYGLPMAPRELMKAVTGEEFSREALRYISPQRMNGEEPGRLDDIYSLGATLYELLTGTPPFWKGEIPHQIGNVRPEGLNERLMELGIAREVPAGMEEMILACLAKDPAERPQTARAIAEWMNREEVGPEPEEPVDSQEPISLMPPEPPPEKPRAPLNAVEEAEAFERSLPHSPGEEAEEGEDEREGLLPRGNWGKVVVAVCAALLLGLGYWWGLQQQKKEANQRRSVEIEAATEMKSERELAGREDTQAESEAQNGTYVGTGPTFSYRYQPSEALALDTNAVNVGVRFNREEYCSFIIAAGETNNSLGTITYHFRAAPGYLIEDMSLSQQASGFTSGRIRGVYSVDGGKTFEEFFTTPPYTGSSYGYGRRASLAGLNASNVMVRYILHRLAGENYNLQFLRDCNDSPAVLEISGTVIAESEARERIEAWATPDAEEGMRPMMLEDGPFMVKEYQGTNVWVMPKRANPHYFYFDVEEQLKPEEGAEVKIEMEYRDAGTGEIVLHYNTTDESAGPDGRYRGHPNAVQRRNSGRWLRAEFKLSDMRLRGGQNENADFRFYIGGDELMARRVRLSWVEE